MKLGKKESRLRRAKRLRKHVQQLGKKRIVVFKSSNHIYGQIIDDSGNVLVSASSLQKDLKSEYCGNVNGSVRVATILAGEALKKGITDDLAFDRSGFKYHGRVKAFADTLREKGLKF